MKNYDQPGFIYILRNPSLRGTPLKIGLTRKSASTRIKSLNTATPDDFVIIREIPVRDTVTAEKRIHLILDDARIKKNKEFFGVDEKIAIEVSELISAYEHEDGSISNQIGFHRDFGHRNYCGMRSVQHHNLMFVLMATTVNITPFDRMVGVRRGIVDGFLSHHQFAKHLSISLTQASIHFKKFQAQHNQILARFFPDIEDHKKTFDMKIFDFLRYHKGELAWRFTDDYRQTFMNSKI